MTIIFEASRVTLSLVVLLYSSWSDYKTREVSNKVWIIFAPLAVGLSLTDFLLNDPSKLTSFGVCFGLTVVFSLLLFYSGAFGGADSKALMCIALALPFFPQELVTPFFSRGVSPLAQNFFPVTILSNGVLFAAATAVYMFSRNFVSAKQQRKKLFEGSLARESIGKKIVVLITGYRMSISKLKAKWHIYPLEDIETEENSQTSPKRRLAIIPSEEGRDAIVERLSNAIKNGKITDEVWASPGLPMLIFLTAGLIIALLFGDIIWLLISFILH